MLKTDILELPIRNKIQDTYVLFLYFVPCSYNKLDSIAKHTKIIYQVFEAKVYYTNNRWRITKKLKTKVICKSSEKNSELSNQDKIGHT